MYSPILEAIAKHLEGLAYKITTTRAIYTGPAVMVNGQFDLAIEPYGSTLHLIRTRYIKGLGRTHEIGGHSAGHIASYDLNDPNSLTKLEATLKFYDDAEPF